MASRMPKSKDTMRVHVQMPKKWRRAVAAAARNQNVSMSSFIAKAAIEKAAPELVEK